jgi:crossover junction endodeoxyribonuclease RusA
MHYELYLPFPPTVNSYYQKSRAGGRFISNKGRMFRDQVIEAVNGQLPQVHVDCKMLVEIVLFPPDNRVRDVDNYNKALLDALSHSGIWTDDNMIDQLFVYRGETRQRNGSVYVRITDAGPVIRDVNMLPLD